MDRPDAVVGLLGGYTTFSTFGNVAVPGDLVLESFAGSGTTGAVARKMGGDVEITVRYITRISEREALRGKLYHTAVERLGGPAAAKATPS